MIVAQAKLNPVTRRQDRTQREIDWIVARHDTRPESRRRLNDLKDTLAMLSGLEAKTQDDFERGDGTKRLSQWGKTECVFRPVQAVFRDEGGCVRLQHHRLDRIEPCAARVLALDSTAATRSAKDVTQASSSRAKTPVRLGPSDPEAKPLRQLPQSLGCARDDKDDEAQ